MGVEGLRLKPLHCDLARPRGQRKHSPAGGRVM